MTRSLLERLEDALKPEDKYKRRYAANWQSIAHQARKATKNRCCNCLIREVDEVHHAYYQDEEGAIAGREVPGVSVFPLCNPCHDRMHRSDRWYEDPFDPVLRNCNRWNVVMSLRANWAIATSLARFWKEEGK